MVRKYVGSILFLCLLIGITIYVLIENNDMRAVAAAMARAEHIWILAGILAALFFVAAEGSIICYLLRAIGRKMPCPALLYEKGGIAIGRQYTGADGSGCAV